MNTEILPFAHGTASFWIVISMLIACFILPMIYFRWKKWI